MIKSLPCARATRDCWNIFLDKDAENYQRAKVKNNGER
jgi:hypothetical protein